MKFVDLLVVAICILCFMNIFTFGFTSFLKLSTKYESERKKYETQKFVAESFKNTCNGNGFDSLNSWQVSCRALFGMDYISWCDAADFMEVSMNHQNEHLLYGTWQNSYCSGEIFFRGKK